MFAALVLASLAFTAVAVTLVFAVVGLALRFAFRLILLPLLLVKWLVMGAVMLVVGPILLVVAAVAAIAFGLALFVPLLPLFAVAAIVWLVVRANRRPAVA